MTAFSEPSLAECLISAFWALSYLTLSTMLV